MKQISFIVPVYNTEKYIRACMESIFRQGLDNNDFEVIIVNDGTQDNSIGVIEDIIKRHSNITVINQENQGLSMARNNGMKVATGEYIAYVDPDDVIANNSIKPLLEQAVVHQPDLIVAEFSKMEDEAIQRHIENFATQTNYSFTVKSGQELLMEDLNPRQCYVWRTLYRRSFLEKGNIHFVPGIFFEDTPFTNECYLKAGKCIKTDALLYLYRIGHTSVTSRITKRKAMDYSMAIAKTWDLTKTKGLSPVVKERLIDNVYAAFAVLIYAITREIEDFSERLQIVKYLKQLAPDLSFSHGGKQKGVTFVYKNCPRTYLYLKHLYQKFTK